VRIVSPLGSGRTVADSETAIFDVGANGGFSIMLVEGAIADWSETCPKENEVENLNSS
jgi:hypothetical protein